MMFNRILQQIACTSSRVPSPACLIDRLLDRIETLSRFVMPANTDNPPYGDAGDRNAPRAIGVVARNDGRTGVVHLN
jgi:hypothetical protein